MKLFEHEAKDIFRTFNMPTPPGGVAKTPTEAMKIKESIIFLNIVDGICFELKIYVMLTKLLILFNTALI